MNIDLIRAYANQIGVQNLTVQQQRFFFYVAKLQNLKAAARAVGTTMQVVERWINDDEKLQELLHKLDELRIESLEVNADLLNEMLMDAWTTAADSTEKVAVVRELAKVNGVGPTNQRAVTQNNNSVTFNQIQGGVQITNENGATEKQIRNLTDQQLMEIAGGRFTDLLYLEQQAAEDFSPLGATVYDKTNDVHVPVDGDFEEVLNEEPGRFNYRATGKRATDAS